MSTGVIHRSVQSSELSRNAAAVFAAAEEGPVDITRRDGADFVLTLASDVARERRAVEIAASLVSAFLSQEGASLAERLCLPFPWVEFLSADARERFADEIVAVTRACAAVGEFTRLLVVFEAWRSSAEAIAHGFTADDDLEWFHEPVTVKKPRRR